MKRFLPLLFLLICWMPISCSNENSLEIDTIPPSVGVEVSNITRTSADISISTDNAADYAYYIARNDEQLQFLTSEELFKYGKAEYFESKTATIHLDDFTGGAIYTVYVATRKINPYVYSKLTSVIINTDISYSDVITMEHIGLTDFTYHIQVPAEASGNIFKHIAVSKNDYEAIKKISEDSGLGTMTYGKYVGAFGHAMSESDNVTIDKYSESALGDAINVYSGTEYMIITGIAPVYDQYNVDESTVNVLEFSTRKASELPLDIDIRISDISSMNATVSVVPDDGITEYRMLVAKTEEFDYAEFEGEDAIRALIIGYWDDQQNIDKNAGKRSYSEAVTFNPAGLMPLISYTVGIVGFDEQRREKVILRQFSTTEPTGPKPEVEVTQNPTEMPWSSASFTIRAKNTSSGYLCLALKSDYDQLLSQGSTLDKIIINNGQAFSTDEVSEIVSEKGLIREAADLSASTEYTLGIYVANPEGVGVSKRIDFTTDKIPPFGGEVRANMPGKYTATTKDDRGQTVTFPVTIATGVNEATEAEYAGKNRLVALGFAFPDQYPYTSPEEMLANGTANDENEANLNYGPKWFIEFHQDGSINTGDLVNYNLDYNMGLFGGSELGFCGYTLDGYDTTAPVFPITVSEDGNTVTIGKYEYLNYDGNTLDYYPGMMLKTSSWGGDKLFAAIDVIVLTRDAIQPSDRRSLIRPNKNLKSVNYVEIDVNSGNIFNNRVAKAEQANK